MNQGLPSVASPHPWRADILGAEFERAIAEGDVMVVKAEQVPIVPKRAISEVGRTQVRAGIEHVLVCLDRSSLAEASLPHAIALAKVFGARMTLLHVMQPPHAATSLPDPLGWEIARQEAQAYLDRVKEQTESLGQATQTLVTQGHPAARIIAAAADVGADLTVLGSHGAGGRAAAALGSTVQQVLASTRGSVFIARSASTGPASVTPHRILVPLDGSTRTECVLPTAARLARANGAELLLVHIVSESVPTAILSAGEDIELARELSRRLAVGAERYLDHIAGALAHEGISVRTLVLRQTDERQALIEVSEKEHVDLMVVSAHGSTCNPARSFGTFATYFLHHAPLALLVIQDLREPEWQTFDAVDDERHATPLRGASHTGPPGAA